MKHLSINVIAAVVWASFAVSLRRLARSVPMIANLGLAGLPVAVALLIVLVGREHQGIHAVHRIYEGFLRILYLHFVVFFVANIFGFAVVRQELEEQTLHYLLLQPVGRWIIVTGKFFAYLTLSSVFCVASLWLTYLVLGLPRAGAAGVVADLFGAGRFVILLKESLVLVLGAAIYGAIGMLLGTFLKSGIYGLLLLVWEGALPYLPSALKFWTVTHYLHSLLPERLAEQNRLFELLGEPASTGFSLTVLAAVAALLFAATLAAFQSKECLYGES